MSWREQYERRRCSCCQQNALFLRISRRSVCVDCKDLKELQPSPVPDVRTADMLYHGVAPDDV